jgi:Fe-S-cluster-containing dehydrogenase component/formate-dependent nitrite reductase membrane component NrfD
MNYGFVIDTRSCIGCHACSTACKSENQVPLGVNRTWVKYVESGTFPDTRRAFQVTRCNHCANPPCVRICPVTAMYQRTDGIVEFDSDVCIGCKACLQACPYDAIYIDPDSGTAAKCHFCGHRVENGLEPACVVVCPTHSIIAGDMDDPASEISRVLAKNDVTVRKPEQGTAPKLFYVQGADVAMHPTATERHPAGLAFADVLDGDGRNEAPDYADATFYEVKLRFGDDDAPLRPGKAVATSGATIRVAGTQGQPAMGPIQPSPARMAGHMVQVGYNAQHTIPWHWQVPAYLLTKSVGSGVFLLLASAILTGWFFVPAGAAAVAAGLGVAALVATTALLVLDLERPERFLRILTRPQSKSWLARGAFLLVAFSGLATVWWLGEVAVALGWIDGLGVARTVLAALSVPLATGTAVYTAWLFAQCEGRDLWQSPLLPFHLFLQALIMGAAGLAWIPLVTEAPQLAAIPRWVLLLALLVDGLGALPGELAIPHASEVAARAAHAITHGRYRRRFWWGAVVVGHVLPVVLLAVSGAPIVVALAGVLAAVGLWYYEHAFVMAPQEIPNS